MDLIKELIDDILTDWAYRVHNGMPNPQNSEHLKELHLTLQDYEIPENIIIEVIQNLINEEENPILKKTIKYKTDDGEDRESTVGGILKKGEDHPAYKQARAMVDKDKPEKKKPKKTNDLGDTEKYMTGKSDKEKNTEDKPKSKADNQREKIGGKLYSEPLETSDEEFIKKNSNNKTTDTFTMPDSVKNNPKIPKKYIQFIERTLNTQKNAKDGTNYSDYFGLGKVGAGQTESNIGELLSMMATTMNRNDRAEFFRSVDEHLQKAKARGEKLHVSPTWVKAAKENSSAILRMMYDTYGPDYEIVGSAWDVKEEFEALGQDYDKKGYSTDIMFTVKVGDKIIKDEISLKQKLKKQRLWNGTIGSAFGAGLLPQHLEQGKGTVNQYSQNQIKNIDNFYQNNQGNINEFLGSVGDNDDFDETLAKVAKKMDNKENNQQLIIEQFNGFLSQYKKDLAENPNLTINRDYIKENLKKQGVKSDKRAMDKVSMTLGLMMDDYGDEMGGEFVKQQKSIAKEHAREVANFINNNEEAKASVLKKVQEKLPLKSVSDGDESVVLGEYIINKKTMKGIFGTDNWDEVVQNLVVNPDSDPPSIQYQGKVGGKDVVIPITTIGIREDGEGYGGTHKFEMTVADDFGKYVESVSRDLFGDQEPIKFPNTPAADLRR